MKRKLVKFLSVIMAAFFLMIGPGFARPAYAYADGPGYVSPDTSGGEESGNDTESGVVVIEEDLTSKKKDTDKTGITVTEEKTGLTPDGNMSLVDDIDGEDSNMQFLTVTTKDGHYFYIVIERNKNSENVHFLNQVDARDLLAIMTDKEVKEYEESLKQDEPQVITPVVTPDPEPETPAKKNTVSPFATLGIFGVLGAAVAGGYYFFKIKPGKQNGYDEDLEFEDDADYVNEDTENEDEPTFRGEEDE